MAQMVRMVATAEHQYAGRRLQCNDEYLCEAQHVSLMEKQGWARRAVDDTPPAAQQYQTRDLAAAGKSRRRGRAVEAAK